jgi:hypothetical protein
MSKQAVWPACVYMDGATPVELPAAPDDPATHCPVAWSDVFCLHRRQGKFPYMHGKLSAASNQTPVAKAFRNYMAWIFGED